jgi:hypothetical protein
VSFLPFPPRDVQPARHPVAQPTNRHQELARRIRRLGTGSRHNAVERFIVERESVAREVEMLGDETVEGETL